MIEIALFFGVLLAVMFWLWVVAYIYRKQLDEARHTLTDVKRWIIIEMTRPDEKPPYLKSCGAEQQLIKINRTLSNF